MEKQNNQFLFSLHHSMMLAAIPPDKEEIKMGSKAYSAEKRDIHSSLSLSLEKYFVKTA